MCLQKALEPMAAGEKRVRAICRMSSRILDFDGFNLVDVLPGLKAGASTPPDGSAVAPQGPPPFLPALKDGVSRRISMNQDITFLSDGNDTLRALQLEMSPQATHILDWFHVTMRLTVLDQYGKGLVHCDAVLGKEIREKMERLKWSLWHGQVDKALGKIDDLASSIALFQETYARFTQLVKALSELRTYIGNNRHLIPN